MAEIIRNAMSLVLMLSLVLVAGTMPLASTSLPNTSLQAYAATAEDFTCADKVAPQEDLIESKLDKVKAKALADNNAELKSRVKDFESVFNSIFLTWSYDPETCENLALDNVNVVYSLSNSTEYVKNVVVTLDSSLTEVVSVSEHVGQKNIQSTNWAGYEFYGNSGHTVNVYESKATFRAPTVSEPVAFWCFNERCAVSVWTGLSAVAGGSPSGLAQGGTHSRVECPVGCFTTYYGWYEFLPAAEVKCLDVRAGDSVTATTTNNAKTGGSNTSYTIRVFNNTLGKNCSTTQTYNMPSPTYGQFILERPSFNGNPARLPNFTTTTFSSATIFYSGASNSISTPYSNGWYNKYIMNNGQGDNVSVSAVSSGSFSITWLKSDGAT